MNEVFATDVSANLWMHRNTNTAVSADQNAYGVVLGTEFEGIKVHATASRYEKSCYMDRLANAAEDGFLTKTRSFYDSSAALAGKVTAFGLGARGEFAGLDVGAHVNKTKMEGAANPFGDPEMAEGDIPFPAPGGAGGFPGGGPPPGGMDPGGMMMAAMPKPEFIVAASIDTEKWLKLKAAPPLAMGMGLAMMQGYSITEKDDFLLIASKDHLQATQTGSVKNPASGPGKDFFANNDFVLKINVAPILKMDLPIPPGGPMEMLKDISHLEIASNSGKTSGTGTMKLVFTDKSKNSLSQVLKIAKAINTIVPAGENGLDGMDEEFEFE